MRTFSSQWAEMNVPNEMCYAFNRNVVSVRWIRDNVKKVYVDISTYRGMTTYTEERTPHINGCEFDISRYMQLFFNRRNIIQGTVEARIVVNIRCDEYPDDAVSFEAICIWGCINIEDRILNIEDTILSGNRISFFGFALDCFKTYIRGKKGPFVEIPQENLKNGINTLDLADYGLENESTVFVDMIVTADRSTFDDSFDLTFLFVDVDKVRLTFNRGCTDRRTILRWIDNFGIFHEKGFIAASDKYVTSDAGASWADYANDAEDAALGYYGMTRKQGFETRREKTLAVPNASTEEWRVLKTLINSPIVLCKTNDTWCDVNVLAGTTEIPSRNYEDFVINVQLPNLIRQTL